MNNKSVYIRNGEKRALDICFSALALVVLSPVLLIVALFSKKLNWALQSYLKQRSTRKR